MNQTAVEFLYEALWEAGKDKFIWQIILQQAKEIEKEQIIDSYLAGNYQNHTAEEYYNQTFK
jgi:hypothetical protein